MKDSCADSLWEKTVRQPRFEALQKDAKTDVLIIGGGIAGILCAYMLVQAGVPCILLEADRIGGGVTGNTTAKITSQHGLIYSRLIQEFGREKAALYLRANQAALERYRRLCQSIDCDFEEQDAFIYSCTSPEKLEKELNALDKLGSPARMARELPLPFPTVGAVCFEKQAQFHPLRFLSAIAKDLPIYEKTRVLALEPGLALTKKGKVRADKIIVTTHFPFLNRHGLYFLKLYQHRSYVLALKDAPPFSGMYLDEAEKGLSFRRYGDLLLLGGGSHRTGKQGGGWKELEAAAQRFYPGAKVAARWAAQDCMSLDGVPYIGPYSARTQGLYLATGFNKWGMTSSMAAAEILTDMLLERHNPCAEVFSPSRTILRPQLAVNACESTLHLLKPTVPRCNHMGCALSYNQQEHTWDCPCHGSRFTIDGELLDGPAQKPLQ